MILRREQDVTGTHLLQGLMKWLTRDEWRNRFAEVYDDHLLPACDQTDLDVKEIITRLGEHWFMSTVWGCAFEDFLTRDFEDGSNIVDDYLKRRGWKEGASTRAYMAALRTSVMSLYEVSDIVRDTSFRARDLVRGGEPIPQTVGPHRDARCAGWITNTNQRCRPAVRSRYIGRTPEVVAQDREAR